MTPLFCFMTDAARPLHLQALQRKIKAINESVRPQTDLAIAILWSVAYILILLFTGSVLFSYVPPNLYMAVTNDWDCANDVFV